jgi:hypothetical protein
MAAQQIIPKMAVYCSVFIRFLPFVICEITFGYFSQQSDVPDFILIKKILRGMEVLSSNE